MGAILKTLTSFTNYGQNLNLIRGPKATPTMIKGPTCLMTLSPLITINDPSCIFENDLTTN